MKKPIAFAAAASLLAATPIPVFTTPVAAQAKNQICMAKRTKGRQRGDKDAIIVVKKAKRASMKAHGFRKVACKGKATDRTEYAREICKFARITPAEVQVEFKKVHGATPIELCQATK